MQALWRARELGLQLVSQTPLTLEGDVPFKGGVVRVRIVLSNDYPALPPRVWRIGDRGEVLGGYVGHHTYVLDQSLCLFRDDGGEGAWRSEYGLDEVLERLRGQAEGSAAGALVEHGSDHDLPSILHGRTLLVSAAQAAILQAKNGRRGWIIASAPVKEGQSLMVQKLTASQPQPGVMVALSVEEVKSGDEAHQELPPQWGASFPIRFAWVRVAKQPWRQIAPTFEAALKHVLSRARPQDHDRVRACQGVVLVRGDGERDMMVACPSGAGFLSLLSQTDLSCAWVQVAELPDAFFARNTPLTAPALAEAHVALVGLGSLGAPVAILLAQAGIRRFTLFDPDKLQPENLSRYPVGVEGLGHHKVQLIQARILAHNPWATVTAWPRPPSVDPESLAHLKTVLDDPNGLIVCTCADPHAEADLNRLAVAHNRPLIIGAAMGAAEHARILRVLPGESACLQCVLLNQRDDPERFPKFEPTEDVGSWAYAGEGIAGLGLDTQEIAAKIARHTLQTLGLRLGGLPYGDAWGDHLLWTRVGGWVFDHPGQTLRVPTTRRPDCEVCHPQAGSSQEDEEALITLLLEEGRG